MLKQTLALVGLMLALSANASYVQLNANIQDHGVFTRDLSTGLDWLDVTTTRGLSYNQVIAQTGVGGALEGWRHATTAELDQLITNFGYVAVNQNCQYSGKYCDRGYGDAEIIEYIINALGDTWQSYYDEFGSRQTSAPAGTLGLEGFVSDSFMPDLIDNNGYAIIIDNEYCFRDDPSVCGNSSDEVITSAGAYPNEAIDFLVGSFLVAPSAVPIPAAAWLFGSALIGLAGIKRKK